MSGEGGPTLADVVAGEGAEAGAFTLPAMPSGTRRFDWLQLLKSPTGAGELSAYKDHPLNPAPDHPAGAGARIARGIEGLTGGARWAVLDILLGAFGLLRGVAAKVVPGLVKP